MERQECHICGNRFPEKDCSHCHKFCCETCQIKCNQCQKDFCSSCVKFVEERILCPGCEKT